MIIFPKKAKGCDTLDYRHYFLTNFRIPVRACSGRHSKQQNLVENYILPIKQWSQNVENYQKTISSLDISTKSEKCVVFPRDLFCVPLVDLFLQPFRKHSALKIPQKAQF